MDDTIVDHSLTCRRSLERLRRSEPVLQGRTLEDIWHEYSRLLEAAQPDISMGRLTIAQSRVERFHRLAQYCGGEISDQEASEFSHRYRENYQRLRSTVPGARRVLERLRGRTVVGVVTNNEVSEQEEKLDHFALRPLIDFMVVSAGVGVAKPDPQIFRIALDRAGVAAEETVMVGDSWKSDITGARNVGIRPVWFNRFHLARPDPWPIPEIDSFRSPVRAEAVVAGAANPPPPAG